MATITLPVIYLNFETSLASAMTSTATSFTLQATTDDDSTALSGTYWLVFDEGETTEEHIIATLSSGAGTVVTRGISRVDATTNKSANQFAHGLGKSVKISNTPLVSVVRLLRGVDTFNAVDWLGVNSISGLATPTAGETTKAANIAYVNAVSIAGANDAAANQKGLVEIATTAESQAGTDTGSTGALLTVLPSDIASNIQNASYSFAADAEASDTYAITLAPAITAYATGQEFNFSVNTANTAGATLNVNALGAKAIVKNFNQALETGDLVAGGIYKVIYDGTNFQLQTQQSSIPTTANLDKVTDLVMFGGDGSDGALDTSGGTVNVNLASSNYVVLNYTSINVVTNNLTFTNPASDGTIIVIKCQGDAVISATIDASGMGAVGGAGGAGGSGGNGSAGVDGTNTFEVIDISADHQGIKGLAGSIGGAAGGAGAGGAIYTNKQFYTKETYKRYRKNLIIAVGSGGGGGAGASANNSGGAGGAGGRGGAGLVLEVRGDINFTGTISVAGADGTAGTSINASGDCVGGSGGGGGAGGMAVILYNSATSIIGTVDTAGGVGGAGGNATSSGGGLGTSVTGGGGGGAGAYGGVGGAGGSGNGTAGNAGVSNSSGGGGGTGGNVSTATTQNGGTGGAKGASDGLLIAQNTEL